MASLKTIEHKVDMLMGHQLTLFRRINTLMAMVQLDQADLDNFASTVETAVGVLNTYVQQLLANQATPLAAADEKALQKALSDLQGLEPPAPAPAP